MTNYNSLQKHSSLPHRRRGRRRRRWLRRSKQIRRRNPRSPILWNKHERNRKEWLLMIIPCKQLIALRKRRIEIRPGVSVTGFKTNFEQRCGKYFIQYLAHFPAFFDFSTSNWFHAFWDWQDLHQAAIPRIHPTVNCEIEEMNCILYNVHKWNWGNELYTLQCTH